MLLERKKTSSTWKQLSFAPIHWFSVEEFGVRLKTFLQENAPVFALLPHDFYDVRREQILFLQKSLPYTKGDEYNHLWKNYYSGNCHFDEIASFCLALTETQRDVFNSIKPFRTRAISQFHVNVRRSTIERIPIDSFSQTKALHCNSSDCDWRTFPRIFTEIDDRLVKFESFAAVLWGVANKVCQFDSSFNELRIVAHHVRVMTKTDRIKSNSPEGIHQDGFPFIVTALVVERENIVGGESQIFDSDKTTPIFTGTLLPGQGILQPDLGTELWHCATDILPIDTTKESYRSSIGLDIQIKN